MKGIKFIKEGKKEGELSSIKEEGRKQEERTFATEGRNEVDEGRKEGRKEGRNIIKE